MTRECKHCVYFGRDGDVDYGHCKRYAPKPFSDRPLSQEAIWPQVWKWYWCGEWRSTSGETLVD